MSASGASATVFFQTIVCMFALLGGGIWTRAIRNRRKPLMISATVSALAATVIMLLSVHFHLPKGFFVLCFLLFALGSGLSIAFAMVCQEFTSRQHLTLAAGFINTFGYLAIAIFSVLIGKLLDSFVPPEVFAAGSAVIYPEKAYVTLFFLLLIPTTISVIASCLIPETGGHYLQHRPQK